MIKLYIHLKTNIKNNIITGSVKNFFGLTVLNVYTLNLLVCFTCSYNLNKT